MVTGSTRSFEGLFGMNSLIKKESKKSDFKICVFRTRILARNRCHVMQFLVTNMVLGASRHFDRMQHQGKTK